MASDRRPRDSLGSSYRRQIVALESSLRTQLLAIRSAPGGGVHLNPLPCGSLATPGSLNSPAAILLLAQILYYQRAQSILTFELKAQFSRAAPLYLFCARSWGRSADGLPTPGTGSFMGGAVGFGCRAQTGQEFIGREARDKVWSRVLKLKGRASAAGLAL